MIDGMCDGVLHSRAKAGLPFISPPLKKPSSRRGHEDDPSGDDVVPVEVPGSVPTLHSATGLCGPILCLCRWLTVMCFDKNKMSPFLIFQTC